MRSMATALEFLSLEISMRFALQPDINSSFLADKQNAQCKVHRITLTRSFEKLRYNRYGCRNEMRTDVESANVLPKWILGIEMIFN